MTVFNAVEALWWGGLGVFLIAKNRRTSEWREGVWLGGWLVLFGATDAIEVWSGAWWKPVWLMFLKGLCIVVLNVGFVLWLRKLGRWPFDKEAVSTLRDPDAPSS